MVGYYVHKVNKHLDKVDAHFGIRYSYTQSYNEFGDTWLLVLKKKPIIFLHWYHHMTVLLYSWHG